MTKNKFSVAPYLHDPGSMSQGFQTVSSARAGARRIAVIANPEAGSRRARHWMERMGRALGNGFELESHVPRSAAELRELCSRLSRKEYLATLVIGGDGTHHQALQGLWKMGDAGAPLYSFPGGTANDLASELRLKACLEQARALLDRNQTDAIDVISVNGSPFSTIAGIGLGALLTQTLNETRKKSRLFCTFVRTLRSGIYPAMSAGAILGARTFIQDVRIESDGFSGRLRVAALFVCNQDRLGASFKIGRGSSNHDGVFEVLVVPAKGAFAMLQDMLTLRSGGTPEGAIRFSTRRLKVASASGRMLPVFGDGEVLPGSRQLDFEIHPASLRVFCDRDGGGGQA